jgi:uncharacterized RDD family membrane protein YckC
MAPVSRRLVSYLIDILVLIVVFAIIGINAAFIWEPLALLSWVVYISYFTYYFGMGQTPGMMVMKIKLIGDDEQPIGYKRGFIRLIGMFISSALLYIGYLWILIDRDKQGWHDKLADSYVVIA